MVPNLNLGDLDLTTDEFILDEVDSKFSFSYLKILYVYAYKCHIHTMYCCYIKQIYVNSRICLTVHIQANLEDDLVKEALKTVLIPVEFLSCKNTENEPWLWSHVMCLYTLLTIFIVQGVDLRQYSKQVEAELQRIEQASIKDCILHASIQFLWE